MHKKVGIKKHFRHYFMCQISEISVIAKNANKIDVLTVSTLARLALCLLKMQPKKVEIALMPSVGSRSLTLF
jgi:hypothetical protein